jgi:hypothetical protein
MAIKLQSTADAGLHGVKMMVYGRAGTGKTTLCSTAPNPIILSAESGLLSLRNFKLPFIEVKDYASLVEAYTWAKTSKEAAQFQTLCVDSVSEIAEVILNEAKRTNKDPRKAYGDVLTQTLALVRDFRDIPGKHVLITAKQEYNKDDSTGITMFGPSMPGAKLGQQLPYYFDQLFQMTIYKAPDGQGYRALRTRPDFQNEAKDRSGRLDEFEPPDLGAIIKKVLA